MKGNLGLASYLVLACTLSAFPAVASGGQAGAGCGDLIGRVFRDSNRNGAQDLGETGVAGAVVVSLDGQRATTDSFGSYHVACVEMPTGNLHTRAVLKVDPRSLPGDAFLISDKVQSTSLTAGKAARLNFAVGQRHDVRMYVHASAFVDNARDLKPSWLVGIDRLIAVLGPEPSMLKMTYYRGDEDSSLAHQRTALLRQTVEGRWQMAGRDDALPIEILMVQPQ